MTSSETAVNKSKESQQSDNKSIEIQAYKVAIENLAAGQDKTLFTNSGPEHAAIVLANIFRTAKKYIKIYTGRFDGCVSNNEYYLDSLRGFLAKGIPLSIIFEDEPDMNSNALQFILDNYKDSPNIKFKKLDGAYPVMRSFNHFVIADDAMFRAEKSNDYSAIGSFNDSKIAKDLNFRFESMEKKSHSILN